MLLLKIILSINFLHVEDMSNSVKIYKPFERMLTSKSVRFDWQYNPKSQNELIPMSGVPDSFRPFFVHVMIGLISVEFFLKLHNKYPLL